MMRQNLKKLLYKTGFNLKRSFTSFEYQRNQFLSHNNIDVIIDVGANIGQYATECRNYGFSGHIISFEPVKNSYKNIKKLSKSDDLWDCQNIGLGDFDGASTINISNNSVSSSIRDINELHTKNAPTSKYVNKEEIIVKKLDSIYDKLIKPVGSCPFLKIDTQGYEKEVLIGSSNSLKFIKGIQIEMSLVELYTGQILMNEIIQILNGYGFQLHNLERGLADKETGQLLQIDGVFFR